MNLELQHHFKAPVHEVAAVMLDLDYQHSLASLRTSATRRVESQQERPDGSVLRHTHYELDAPLPGAARRLLGGNKPSWTEEAIWHPEERRWEWKIVPRVAKDLLSAKGAIELGERGERTLRSVVGTVEVRVPLYGSKVERVIIDGLRRGYDGEAKRLQAWLEDGGRRRLTVT